MKVPDPAIVDEAENQGLVRTEGVKSRKVFLSSPGP